MSAPMTEKLAALARRFEELGSVLVCYSGGVDSAFVLAAAHRALGDRALGMTAVSASLPPEERDEAVRIAKGIGARHRLVDSHELERAGYVANGPDRCFHCKTELYDVARHVASEEGLAAVVNGTNVDDLGDYRPGLEAAANAGALSPLVELGFTKADVRAGAERYGLPIWDKPASACLSSRIPYGTAVTTDRLARIGALESALRSLGFRQVRVRFHDDLARIELDPAEIPRAIELREAITKAGKTAGFLFVTLDLLGYRRGSHNEALALSTPRGGPGKRALPIV